MRGRETLVDTDRRDLEIERLKAENERLRKRERAARAEAESAKRHFAELTATSRSFAASMRSGAQERKQHRRRLAAQLAVSRVLSVARDLHEAAPQVFEVLGERLGWEVGALWTVDGDVLRCAGRWRCAGAPPGAFEEACEGSSFRRGAGLPGRVWERGEPVWVEDVVEDPDFTRKEAAAEDGLHGAFAFPIADGGLVGVFEFFRREVLPPDEDLLRTAALIGKQIDQFVERRRAEEALRESEARQAFLLALSDRLRLLSDPKEVMTAAAETLGRQLGLSRVGYCEVEADEDTVVAGGEFGDGRTPNLVGHRFRLSDYGPGYGPTLRAGEDVFFEDIQTDSPGMPGGSAEARAIRAGVAVPLNKGGRLVAYLYAAHPEPRPWPDDERRLFREVAERTWSAVERVRAEQALRESEARSRLLASVVQNSPDFIGVSDTDGMPVFANDAALRLVGSTWEQARHTLVPDYFVPEERGFVRDVVLPTVLREGRWAGELTLRHFPTGAPVPVLYHVFRVDDPVTGEPVNLATITQDITDKKRAEQELRESEERLKAALHAGRMATWDWDPAADQVTASDTMHALFGLMPGETFQSSAQGFRLVHSDDVDRHRALVQATAKRGESWHSEFRIIRPRDGAVAWLEERATAKRDPQTGLVRMTGLVWDITERKRAEEEREELRREAETERARLEAILRQMPGGVFIADPSGSFVLANEGAERIYGRRIRSLEECSRHTLTYPEGGPTSPETSTVVRALGGEYVSGAEHYVVRPDGTRRIVSANAAPVCDERGRVVAAVKAFEDITSQKEAEKALRESEERLRTVVEGTPVVFFAMDREGVFTLAEGQGLRAVGLEPDEVVGRSIFELFGDEPEVPAAARRALAGETFVVDPSLRGRVFETWYSPLRDEGGSVSGVIGVATDVTERRRAEEERDRSRQRELEARAEVQEAQKRLAFYAGAREERQIIGRELHDRVAHSMAVVRQCLQLHEALKDRDPKRAGAKLKQAEEEAKAALTSTRDLSMMLRRSEVEGGLEKALADLLESTVPPGMRYDVSVRGDETLVPAHVGNQLFLILREAVRNAAVHSDCERVEVGIEVTLEAVTGAVQDDGLGFEADGTGNNGGVGLRSMKERAALVGGTFRVSSGPESGTRIEVCVPLERES